MSLGPEEIIRNEESSVLSAPVNVISDDALDCGCKQLPCPRLAKYATRPAFVSILSVIGILQGATQAYLLISSPTVSRRFGIDYNSMDWVLGTFYITQCVGGLAIAYWGDRIHRASWTGALVLLQSICFLTFMIPQFTHPNKSIEEPIDSNVTHLSMYAEDSPEICAAEGSARIINGENDTCYFVLFLFTVAQILSGLVSVSYYALGLSYLDDNTKKKNVPIYMGWIISMNLMGLLFGSLLAWSFLKIDVDNFNPIESYREQIGAWWLGWPIMAILLAIPALLLAIFPRRLVSEVIEQAAGKILNDSGNSGRSYNVSENKIGSTSCWSSLLRLLKNKILILNVCSVAFSAMALYNFLMNENIFLESRFYIPRPNNILLGFNDPITSRAVAATLKPLLVGLTVIISGFVLVKFKPKATYLARYNAGVILIASIVILGLAFNNCDKKDIFGNKYGRLQIPQLCNLDCRCTRDADFRPVCDASGMYTFYSACYAGCRSVNVVGGIRSYDNCKCIDDMTGRSSKAFDGSCDFSKCQPGWITFEVLTLLVYVLASSTIVIDLLINLRSSYVQDKALVIAFTMTWVALFIQIPGKLIYKSFADSTCQHWGLDNQTCRFHTDKYGYYLCFVTFSFLLVSAIFKGVVSFLCNNLNLFEAIDTDEQEGAELQEVTQFQSQPLLNQQNGTPNDEANNNNVADVEENPEPSISQIPPEEPKVQKVNHVQCPTPQSIQSEKPDSSKTVTFASSLRPNSIYASVVKSKNTMEIIDSSSDESNVFSKSPDSKIGYRPLELDSDTESDLFNHGPRSRQRVPSKTDDQPDFKPFPNPDNYEDPREARGYVKMVPVKPARKELSELSRSQGDFNEIGIPIVDYERSRTKFDKSHDSIVMCQYGGRSENEGGSKFMRSLDEMRVPPDIEKTLTILTESFRRPPSRDQESSGFGSLQNISDSPVRQSLRRTGSKESDNSKTSASTSGSHSKSSPIVTDL